MHETRQDPCFVPLVKEVLNELARCLLLDSYSKALISKFSGVRYPRRHTVGLVRSFQIYRRVALPGGSQLPLHHLLIPVVRYIIRNRGLDERQLMASSHRHSCQIIALLPRCRPPPDFIRPPEDRDLFTFVVIWSCWGIYGQVSVSHPCVGLVSLKFYDVVDGKHVLALLSNP